MTIELEGIIESILSESKKLSVGERRALEAVIKEGHTLTDIASYMLNKHAQSNKALLEPVIDEIFVDFHIIVTLIMTRKFKAACILLRTCLETSLYLLYFVDHSVEARLWAENHIDMSYKTILDQVARAEYLRAASDSQISEEIITVARKELEKEYKALSERVHGKYAFLQYIVPEREDSLTLFTQLVTNAAKNLIILFLARCTNREEAIQEIPALQRIRTA